MSGRTAQVQRKTGETVIDLTLNLDGTGICAVDCPLGFLEHMLTSFCKHGLFDLAGSLSGDLHVDQHHLVEDSGIVLGQAFDKALGTRAGITRSGCFLYPMDETLARAAVDFGGRPWLECSLDLSGTALVATDASGNSIPAFQTDTVDDFWQGFATGAKCNLHLDILRGRSDHHKIEAAFKAAARAIRQAVTIDPRLGGTVPSTKGTLTD